MSRCCEAGKGSARRPARVSAAEFAANWDRVFRRRTLTWCLECHDWVLVFEGEWRCPLCGAEVR